MVVERKLVVGRNVAVVRKMKLLCFGRDCYRDASHGCCTSAVVQIDLHLLSAELADQNEARCVAAEVISRQISYGLLESWEGVNPDQVSDV